MQIQASRIAPTGLHAGAPLSTIDDVASIFASVSKEMHMAEQQLYKQLQITIPAVSEIGQYLASAGGKRFRPLLTCLGAGAAAFDGSVGELACIGAWGHPHGGPAIFCSGQAYLYLNLGQVLEVLQASNCISHVEEGLRAGLNLAFLVGCKTIKDQCHPLDGGGADASIAVSAQADRSSQATGVPCHLQRVRNGCGTANAQQESGGEQASGRRGH